MEYAATKCGCPRPRADSLNASTQTSSVLAEGFSGFVSIARLARVIKLFETAMTRHARAFRALRNRWRDKRV